jgi:hypothetical protein
MTAPVYCERCEAMTHPTFPHSCFSAATLRAHKDAEQKVIAAAKAWATDQRGWLKPLDEALAEAVAALRAVEGDA